MAENAPALGHGVARNMAMRPRDSLPRALLCSFGAVAAMPAPRCYRPPMSKPRTFRQADLERALRAAIAERLTVTRVVIEPGGESFRVETAPPAPARELSPYERWLAEQEGDAAAHPKKDARRVRREAVENAQFRAFQGMLDQWMRDRAEGRPFTKYDVRIGPKTVKVPS